MSADFEHWTYGRFVAETIRLSAIIAAPETPPDTKAKAHADLEVMRVYLAEHAIVFDDGWRPGGRL